MQTCSLQAPFNQPKPTRCMSLPLSLTHTLIDTPPLMSNDRKDGNNSKDSLRRIELLRINKSSVIDGNLVSS